MIIGNLKRTILGDFCFIKNKIIRNIKKNLQNPEKLLLSGFFKIQVFVDSVPFLEKQSQFFVLHLPENHGCTACKLIFSK